MFSDTFLPQVLLFVVVHFAAWGNMRTGRFFLGFAQFAAAWILADAALVIRFVLEDQVALYLWTLVVFQGLCLLSAYGWFFGRWRRARPSFQENALERFSIALDTFMKGEDREALAIWEQLFKKDPWDASAAFMVGTAKQALGEHRSAGSWFRRARHLSHEDPILRDEILEELRLIAK